MYINGVNNYNSLAFTREQDSSVCASLLVSKILKTLEGAKTMVLS